MNRYRTYGPMDDLPEIIGDAAFTRLDMRSDPAALPPGSVTVSENFRFDSMGAQVRAGITRQFPAGTNIGQILLADIYRPDRSGDRFALILSNALALFYPADQAVTVYPFPSGETVNVGDPVDFEQGGIASGTTPSAWILRGFSKDALKFDGASVTVDAAFKRGEFGLFIQDRFAVNDSTQSLQVSDFLDFTIWTLLNQFKILWGGDDSLVGLLAYQKGFVIIGCRKRFFVAFFDPKTTAAGYSGGLDATTSFMHDLTREAGVVGRFAMREAAGLIWFVSDNAIFAFQPQLDLELTVLGKPISADIQPIMDRLSAKYASAAAIEHYGYRLYFALPISDVPIAVNSISVAAFDTIGIDLPFDLPALLATGGVATVTTAEPHDLRQGDIVHMAGAIDALLNGEVTVTSTPDDTHFTFATDATPSALVGDRVTAQKIATRNNVIAVFNLNLRSAENPLGAWESIDSLPSGFFADWLRGADYGARRRLWVVDRDAGPALYEEGDADEIGDIVGGAALPFDLPVELSAANFATTAIPGRLKSRRFRWGPFVRQVRAGGARVSLTGADRGTNTLQVYSPDANVWTGSRTFDGAVKADTLGRKRCGRRGLEAAVEVLTVSGRPTVRTLEIETLAVGRTKEE